VATRVQSREASPEAEASPSCLTTNLGWLLAQAEDALAKELAVALEPLGLGSRGYCVLASALGAEHTQIELAKLIGLDKTTMVVTIDGLERAGLAKRRPSSTDRRAHVVTVTKAGERKVAEARKVVDQVQEDVLARLPARQRAALLDGLGRLVSDRSPAQGARQ
jgi:MarR family transcriptional regulator, transcriptional regulator for hemolysin